MKVFFGVKPQKVLFDQLLIYFSRKFKDEKLNMSIKNFDEALLHPDNEDLKNVKQWIKNILKSDARE